MRWAGQGLGVCFTAGETKALKGGMAFSEVTATGLTQHSTPIPGARPVRGSECRYPVNNCLGPRFKSQLFRLLGIDPRDVCLPLCPSSLVCEMETTVTCHTGCCEAQTS